MQIQSKPILIAEAIEPKLLSAWINYQAPLTDKLQRIKGSSDLVLLSQQWDRPLWWDAYLLQIKDELVFQREIIMRSHDVDYWYARTVIPQKCYDLSPVFFKRLEHESIRNLIFETQEVHRVSMTCYPIDKQCLEFYWVKKHINTIKGILWVRLAEYSFQHCESFYLMEILFPELGNVAE